MKRYWFRAKKYGYGWEPATWEGWLVMALFFAGAIYIGIHAERAFENGRMLEDFAVPLVVLVGLLLAICWRTGEKPRFQWGGKKQHKH
jgi:uncharacterized membrane protein YraQ (UPF0718 family)